MQRFGVTLDTPAIAAAEKEAKDSAAIVGQSERENTGHPTGTTPGGSVSALTSRDIEIEVYKRLGWSR